MKCVKCNAELRDDAVYCHLCGRKQDTVRKYRMRGDGSYITRANGTVEFRVTVDVGVKKSFYGKTKREARMKYDKYLTQAEQSVENVKFVKAWSERWLEIYKKDKVAYGTYRNYKHYVENHIVPEIGHLRIDKVRPAHIAELFSRKTNLSASAQKHINVALKGIFDTAIENKLCLESPVKRLSVKKQQDTVKVFKKEQLNDIISKATVHKYGIYVLMPLYTGLRLGEARALRWSDVDFDSGIISVRHSVARADGGTIIKLPKSNKVRYIGLKQELKDIMLNMDKSGDYVFSNDAGKPISDKTYWRRYKEFFNDTGIDYLSPHKCRHTHATYLLRGGADLRSVQEALGHSASSVTEQYTHIDTDDIKKSIDKLNF